MDEKDIYEKMVENINLVENYESDTYIGLFKRQKEDFDAGIECLVEILQEKLKE